MAAGDVQIAIPNGPAPTTKKVVGETPVVPKAINGTFDGTGAAGPFLPCLVIAGKEGFEVARIPAPQVAAGASAEVSWFPRVSAAAATGAGISSWAAARLISAQNIQNGVSQSYPFASLDTNDPATFSLPGGGPGPLKLGAVGTYAIWATFRVENHSAAPVANPWTTTLLAGVTLGFGLTFVSGNGQTDVPGAKVSAGVQAWCGSFLIFVSSTGPSNFNTVSWFFDNGIGTDVETQSCGVGAVLLP